MDDFIKMLVGGYSNSLLICSRAGTGKTSAIFNTLNKAGLKQNQHYLYYSNYVTPVEMFNVLSEVNQLGEPKLLILDDVELVLSDRRVVSMLRGALWGANGHRTVNYVSGTYRIEHKSISDFEGRIIFLVNTELKNSPIYRALKDRGLFFSYDLTNQEILKIIRQKILPQEYKGLKFSNRLLAYNFLELWSANNPDWKLTLRDLFKLYDFNLYNQNKWQELWLKMTNNQSANNGLNKG